MLTREHQTKTDWITAELRAAISDGRLKQGERLRAADWAERLDVSATPVREAIATLASEGYVRVLPHRGAVVAGATIDDFEDAHCVRRVLDVLAAELTVQRLPAGQGPAVARRLRAANKRLGAALQKGQLERAEASNAEFHGIIYEQAGSRVLFRTLSLPWVSVPGGRRVIWDMLTSAPPGTLADYLAEHEVLANAIEAGNVEAATAAALVHADNAIVRLRQYMAQRESAATMNTSAAESAAR